MPNLTNIDETLTTPGDIRCWTVNALCSEALTQTIHRIQDKFIAEFGDDVFCPRDAELHMTLFNWIDPFITYPRDKAEVFDEIYSRCASAMKEVLRPYTSIKVEWNKLEYRDMCVVLEGFDQGECNAIREDFLGRKVLPVENHGPPRDVHVTFVTFRKALDKNAVLRILNEEKVAISENIEMFRLSFCPKPRMQEHTELERFGLCE